MSSQVWKVVYRTIRMVNRSIPKQGRRQEYSDTLIVEMYLWAVVRPTVPITRACFIRADSLLDRNSVDGSRLRVASNCLTK